MQDINLQETKKGILTTAQFHHTCFVVNDVDKAAQQLADSMGLQWNLWTVEPVTSTVHGQDVPFSLRVALAQVGESTLEITAPLTGSSIYAEHLQAHGEGCHHTCVTYATFEELYEARDEMLKQGRVMLQSASLGAACEFFYFDIPEIGAILELLYVDMGLFPPPEKVIG